ncbi:protein farnesyltransferase subunit beta-like [Calliopsis andreniformis]|uniref:protein farnesyltransferase subunit beta-like n=1 Tax=Calliopsis andreniformis TaxID=337506 RepID=UPI003FCE2B81
MSNSMFFGREEQPVRQFDDLVKLQQLKQHDEGYQTSTSDQQNSIENDLIKYYKMNTSPILRRRKLTEMLTKSLTHLNDNYEHLDCSRVWLCFWILHSLDILGKRLEDDEYSKIINFVAKCQSPEGGFGGGPGQYPHLASTYAAVNTLCIIGTPEAYQIIDRKALKRFLISLHREDGSFSLHVGGEVDMRGVYCAVVVAKLTNVYTPEMFEDSLNWIIDCQTWEGGFGGVPGMEAHGGYTYCGLAALVLLGKTDFCHIESLLRWITNKQTRLEGGFQGRTNKIVDSCYSFWQGASFPIIQDILEKEGKMYKYWLFDQAILQEYLLICCQHPRSGFVDNPGSSQDMYHTCYALSGLSVAQNSLMQVIIGPPKMNLVEPIQPLYNLLPTAVNEALKYFNTLPIPD